MMVDARPRRLDHQRLRMAVERRDDQLFDRMIDGGVAFDHRLGARRERADKAISEEHAEEGADERRADHRAEDRRRLVDRAHRLHDAEHRGDDAERGKRVGKALQTFGGLHRMMMVALQRIIHHLFDRVRIERTRRHDDEAQRVADQVDERVVLQKLGILLKDRRVFRILDVRLDGNRSFGAHHLHQGRDEQDAVEIILLLILRSLEHLGEPAAERLQVGTRIADDQRAECRTADDQHFVRQRVHDGTQIAAGQREAPEDQQDQYDNADNGKHVRANSIRTRLSKPAPANSGTS